MTADDERDPTQDAGAPPAGDDPAGGPAGDASASAAGEAAPTADADGGPPVARDPGNDDAALRVLDGDGDDPDVDEEVAAAEAAVADDITRVMSERDDYLDALRRLQADFENYKKRVLKQQTDHLERAAEDLVVKLLPVLDAGDLALAHGGGDDVVQVSGMLYDTLAKEGLERVEAGEGTAFDPTVHDAVAHEAGDGAEVTVVEVLRAGYRWKGRLVRPAMVRVKG